jgi:hypothetical protein
MVSINRLWNRTCQFQEQLWQNFLRFSYFKNLSKAQALPGGGGCLDLTDANALKFIVPFLWTKLTITMTITSFKRFCHKIQRPSVQAHCWETRVSCLYTNYFPVNWPRIAQIINKFDIFFDFYATIAFFSISVLQFPHLHLNDSKLIYTICKYPEPNMPTYNYKQNRQALILTKFRCWILQWRCRFIPFKTHL